MRGFLVRPGVVAGEHGHRGGVGAAGHPGRLELAPFLAERGRSFPGGYCASVGLGGYLLQGGQGWDGRARGWACQSVVGLDVVTADGTLVRADASENCDLLWAARGAGPGFPGVVTRFYLQTYPAPTAMWHDTWSFGLEDTVDLLTWLHEMLPGLDRWVEPVVAATRETEHSFSIWYEWAPAGSRPDMAFSVEADVYVATYVIYNDPADDARHTDWVHRRTGALAAAHGTGVYLGDTDFTRRQDRFLSDDAYRRLVAIQAERDPSDRFASYLTRDPEGLSVHG